MFLLEMNLRSLYRLSLYILPYLNYIGQFLIFSLEKIRHRSIETESKTAIVKTKTLAFKTKAETKTICTTGLECSRDRGLEDYTFLHQHASRTVTSECILVMNNVALIRPVPLPAFGPRLKINQWAFILNWIWWTCDRHTVVRSRHHQKEWWRCWPINEQQNKHANVVRTVR